MTPEVRDQLRRRHYNARVIHIRRIHDDLMTLRVASDAKRPSMLAGQYALLGLGCWEDRIDGLRSGARNSHAAEALIRRAYSISCPILDDKGVTRIDDLPFLEFYFNCIHKPSDDPPMLTPRLFALREGDRLYMGLHSHGRYTVETIGRNENVIFAATGTGEAPHNAMVAELLSRGHIGRIAVVTCVRYRDDLGYVSVHRALERRFLNYRYVPLTTREPENVDPSHPSFVGKTYLQDLFASESAVQKIGFPLDPLRTHVYLCGAPAMIGLPKRTPDGDVLYPEPIGMVEVLVRLGFRADEPHNPGTIHFEKYW